MGSRSTSPVTVGRTDERESLASALERARDGTASLVLLGGSAGVGKTRLITEFAGNADARVLIGGCVDLGDGALPYAPLVEALRRLRTELGQERVRALAGPDARELTRLLPGLVRDVGADGQQSDRGLLYESLLAFVDRLAAERPLVLGVEDLHWADRSTLDLLAFLARNLSDQRILLVATFRSDDVHRTHPLRPWLAELTRLPGAERVDLRPFTREELTEQLTAILGDPPDGSLVDTVLDRSEGNPFYAEELLAAGTDVGALPPSLHDVLAARISKVPPGARAVVRLAAAAGRQVDHALLARVAALPEADLHDGLRAALANQVLITDTDGTAYRFRHALLQEVAYGELLPGERVGLHADIARVLEEHPELAAGGAEFADGELAHHWAAARDAPRAFTSALAAASSAERSYAFAEALAHLERALELWDQVPSELATTVPPRYEVLSKASEMAGHAAEQRRSIGHARAALDEAEHVAAPPAAIAALLRTLSYLSWLQGDLDDGLEHLDRALATAGDEPTVQLAQVLGWRSRLLVLRGRPQEAIEPAERAAAIARELGSTREEGYALNSIAVARAALDDTDGALSLLRDARRLALVAGAVEDTGTAFVNETSVLAAAGRCTDTVEVATEGQRWADGLGHRLGIIVWIRMNAVAALLDQGCYDEAERWLAATPLPHDDLTARHLHRIMSAWLHLVRGDLEVARVHGREADDLVRGRSFIQLVATSATLLAHIDRAEGRYDDGLVRLEAVLHDEGAWTINATPHRTVRLYACLAAERSRAARDRGDQATAEEALVRLGQVIDRAGEAADAEAHGYTRRSLQQAVLQARAERASVVGEPDPDAWRAAVAAFPETPGNIDVLLAQTRLADALVATGDRDEAAAVVNVTLATARESSVGQIEIELAALARRARLRVETASAIAGPETVGNQFGLTAREEEVLALVAAGSTNRQIGEALFITDKTASVHVSNILTKLGVSNRGEAAAVAHRAGVTDVTATADRVRR